jgi:hypothetical protein
MIELNTTSTVGLLLMSILTLGGLYVFRDNLKLKTLTFLIGIGTASILMGLDVKAMYFDLVNTFSSQVNTAGVVASMVSAGVASASPIKLIRNGGLSLSSISLMGALWGLPTYISIGITVGLISLFLYLLFRFSAKGLSALKDMSRQKPQDKPNDGKSLLDKIKDFVNFIEEKYHMYEERRREREWLS